MKVASCGVNEPGISLKVRSMIVVFSIIDIEIFGLAGGEVRVAAEVVVVKVYDCIWIRGGDFIDKEIIAVVVGLVVIGCVVSEDVVIDIRL
jgi:hypothetical protein